MCAREIERRRHRGIGGRVGPGVLQLRLRGIRLILRNEERKAVVFPRFDLIDFVRRKIVAQVVLSRVVRPHAAGLRIPVEADGVVQAARVRLQRTIGVHHLNRRAARIGLDTDVARRANRDVQPSVRADVDRPRHVDRRRRARQIGKLLRIAGRLAVHPLHPHHRRRRRDVEKSVLESQTVRVGQVVQNDFGLRPAVLVAVWQRDDLVAGPPRDQQDAFRAHGHQARPGEVRCEHRRLETRRNGQVRRRCHDGWRRLAVSDRRDERDEQQRAEIMFGHLQTLPRNPLPPQ